MKQFTLMMSMLFAMTINLATAQTGECSGMGTEADEGSFSVGYDYQVVTNGTDVTVTATILDPDLVGLVAFIQSPDQNPFEVMMAPAGGQTFTHTYANQVDGESFDFRVKWAFAGGLATMTYVEYVVGEGCVVVDPTECAGMDTAADEGAFNTGYEYSIVTSGTDVILTCEILDPNLDGLVAFMQTLNPDFAEVPMAPVAGQTFIATIADQTPGNQFSVRFKFAFAGGLATTTYIDYVVGEGCAEATAEIDLPVTFDDPALNYGIRDFDGTTSTIVADPEDGANSVVQTVKASDAAFFAGTVVADAVGLINPIPFSEGNTTMTVRVWSPVAPVALRMKVENNVSPGTNVETETILNTASAWTDVTFDFANNVDGSPALDVNGVYNMMIMFFDFGNAVLDETGIDQTYYFDDIQFGGSTGGGDQIDLPITFDDAGVDYGLVAFEGAASEIVVDPTDAGNMVGQTLKDINAGAAAGTIMGEPMGFANPIPFSEGNTMMNVRVWSPVADIPVRLKVEQAGNPGVSVETEATFTTANEWQTLTFDFTNQAAGTAELNVANTYNKAVIFFDFGTDGATAGEDRTYYWDDVQFGLPQGTEQVDLPITFDDPDVNYALTAFEGAASEIVVDPTDSENMVGQTLKDTDAGAAAGTIMGEPMGFVNPIPFSEGNTTMSVRVWSPVADIPIRLKVEEAGNPGVSVETEATFTTANEWQTLTFDFTNQAAGTAELNLASTYNKAVIFFDFGTDGATAGEDRTYYWDDVEFGGSAEPFTVVDVILNSPVHTTLATALEEAELIDALNGDGPFTVFAPTNDAFDALPEGVLSELLADPTGDLQQILLYHVLGIQVLEADITAGPQTTLQGEDLTIAVDGAMVMVDEANVTDTDLTADNGVVHVIDNVITPSTITIGLEELTSNAGISVWPNPTTDMININFTELNTQGTTVSIYDVSGKIIYQTNINNSLTQINVSSYPAGHYIMRIDTPDAGYYKKMVVTR